MTVIDGSKVTLGNGQLATGTAVERDVMVEMSDGVRIACDVYRPRAEGEYPVLYAVSPYLKDAVYLPTMACYRYRETGKIANWVARGYVYVHADARGCGKSEGRYVRFSEDELRDLYEMIEWCGTQPWSTGKVGGFGESYYAMVQWAAAAQNPPHLACIAPYDGLTDYYRHSAWKGGIYSTTFESHWYGNSVRNRAYLDFVEKPDRDDFMAYDYLLDLIKHPTFDAFWQRRRFDVTAIKVPVFSIGNWNNAGATSTATSRASCRSRAPGSC
jgi:putative CocE/NonD family hydrolase